MVCLQKASHVYDLTARSLSVLKYIYAHRILLHVSVIHWPYSGRCMTKVRYIELQKFLSQCKDIKCHILKIIHGLKYTLGIKMKIISVIDSNV